MTCSKKPKHTFRKNFENISKTSTDIISLPNKNKTKANKNGKTKGRGGGYGRSKNFIKAKNTRIYKVRTFTISEDDNEILVEMDYTNKQLNDDELEAKEILLEENSFLNEDLIISDGSIHDFYGEIEFPNLPVTSIDQIYIVPIFNHPVEHALEPTAVQEIEGENDFSGTGFRSQDQNTEFPELYEYIHFWRKKNDDDSKGMIYQFHAWVNVDADDAYVIDFEIWFQALNNQVWAEIQHNGE